VPVPERDQEAKELNSLGITHCYLGDLSTAHFLLEESAALARETGNEHRLAAALSNLGLTEAIAGDLDRATEVLQEAVALDEKHGDQLGLVYDTQGLTMISLLAGRAEEARGLLAARLDFVASAGDSDILASTLELAAGTAAGLGEPLRAARMAGAAEAVRQIAGMPIAPHDAELLEGFLAPARKTTALAEWDAEYGAGRALSQEQAATLLLTLKE